MKKTLLSLLLLSPLLSLCQEKKNSWFLRPYGSVAAGNEYTKDLQAHQGMYFDNLRVFGAGLDVGRTFGQFYLSAGLGWQQMGELTKSYVATLVSPLPVNEPSYYRYDLMWKSIQYRNYVTIPLSAGCNVGWFFVQANIIPSYFVSGNYKAIESNDPNVIVWNEDPNYDPDYLKRELATKFNVLGGLTIGIKVPVTKRIGIQLAADAKYSLIDVNKRMEMNGKANYRHLNLGGVAGLVYSFGK